MRKLIVAVDNIVINEMITDAVNTCKEAVQITAVNEPQAVLETLLSCSDSLILISQEIAGEVLMRISPGTVCTNFAVVSGERYFVAMREAFRRGALDYFVLPEDMAAMSEFLCGSSAYFEHDMKRTSLHRLSTVNTAMRVMYDEHLSPGAIDDLNSVYGECFRSDYQVLCMADGDTAALLRVESLLSLRDNLGQMVLVMPAKRLDNIEKRIEELAVGISRSHTGLAGVHTAYREALSARKNAFFANHSCTWSDKDIAPQRIVCADRELEQAIQYLAAGKCAELIKCIQEIFRQAVADELNHNSVDWFLRNFSVRASAYFNHDGELERLEAFANPWQFENSEDYIAQLEHFLDLYLLGSAGESEVSQNKQKIQRAIEYIAENYSGVLNMAIVSNYVSMNYSLFSLEFKRYTKMNFVKYLQNFRINESRRLLLTTDYRISEISRMTGFRDDKHFMKVFKSICGVSPSEYRRNNSASSVGDEV